MKRIAAVAALIVAMLAVPAAAMASTNGPGPGSGYPGPGQWGQFCQPNQFHHHYGKHHKHHKHHPYGFSNCFYPPPPPPSEYCQGQSFIFSWVSGSNGIYEISGPALYTGEQFSYYGNLYTIVLANPIAGSMLVNSVNSGPTIFEAVGYIC